MGQSLYEKVFSAHEIQVLPSGQSQLLIGVHLLHEVTSPQAFGMLREMNLPVAYPQRTFGVVDHIIPTTTLDQSWDDPLAIEMYDAVRKNCESNGIKFFGPESGGQGVIHVIGPDQGLTQPGMTLACGDSHTATHGAFGMVAFGVGTSQVRDILATQTMVIGRLKTRKIVVNGKLSRGVGAKDVILHIIRTLGVNGGTGYAYEYAGQVIDAMDMEGRMTVCNMSIEGGARVGYVNPDDKTFAYLKGKPYAPKGKDWNAAVEKWKTFRSDPDARYDDIVEFDASKIKPTVTWGVTPAQAIAIDEAIPDPDSMKDAEQASVAREAVAYMKVKPGTPVRGLPVNVVFIGSCTNGRISDFREAAAILKGRKIKSGIRALAVPGSQPVDALARKEGLNKIFEAAGFEWRLPGCSMCLAMNPDKLVGDEVCASTSNRNFKGRQGSPTGRTMLMSPGMAAAAAIEGKIADVRDYL